MPSRECYHFRYFKSILAFPCFKQCFTMQSYLVITGSALHSDPTGCIHQQMLHDFSTPTSSIFQAMHLHELSELHIKPSL